MTWVRVEGVDSRFDEEKCIITGRRRWRYRAPTLHMGRDLSKEWRDGPAPGHWPVSKSVTEHGSASDGAEEHPAASDSLASASSDVELAKRVKTQCEQLNELICNARKAGLRVEVDVTRAGTMRDPYDKGIINILVSRPL
jgi:hypothetical protein